MKQPKHLLAILGIFLLAATFGCSKRPASTADIPRLLPSSWQISVAPFTQPRNPSQLITGHIPEPQGQIPQDALADLDMDLRSALMSQTKRKFNFIPSSRLPSDWHSGHSGGQPAALARWLAYGEEHGAHFLLVPQVFDWHDREGSEGGVTKSASVRLEFYLLDVPGKKVLERSIYEEKQVGLVDNLFTVADFIKRRGQWVTSRDLAAEGMAGAIREMGL